MVNIDALWRDGHTPRPQAVKVGRDGDELVVDSGNGQRRFLLADCKLEAGIDTLPDSVYLPDGSTLEVAQKVAIRRLLGGLPPLQAGGHWLQQSWRALAGGLLAALVILWLGWRFVLPAAAGWLVPLIPLSVEQQLAAQTLSWLQGNTELAPSRLPASRAATLQAQVARLQPAASRYRYQVLLRHAPDIGPNAFALPGGTIVVTDQLLAVVTQPDEILAILAHEAGHVEHRHGLRSAVESVGVLAALTLMTGDASSLTLALPVALANASYSREHEREADRFAYTALQAQGLSPCLLGYGLQRIEVSLKQQHGDAAISSGSWFASHPATTERSKPLGQACPPPP